MKPAQAKINNLFLVSAKDAMEFAFQEQGQMGEGAKGAIADLFRPC